MSSVDTQDDYDKLSPQEREIRDKADRQREAEEQAGRSIFINTNLYSLKTFPSLALLMETNAGRC
jgi:hypothetical protein